jgi:hypothetical protein
MAKAVRKSTPAVKKSAAVIFLDPELAPDLYALIVTGECMAPLHPAGSAVLVDKRQPYESGDLIVIYMKPEAVKPGHSNCMIKRLVSMPPWVTAFPYRENPKSEVHALATVEMLRPAQRIHFLCSDILAIHRCLGAVPASMRLTGPLAAQVHGSDVSKRSDLTRRGAIMNALAGAAFVAAASTLPALGKPGTDARLLELDVPLTALIELFTIRHKIEVDHLAAYQAAVQEVAGVPADEWPDWREDPQGWQEHRDIHTWVSQGFRDTDDYDWKDYFDRMGPLVSEIISETAHTIPGLAVQVRAIMLREWLLWGDEFEPDNCTRIFIEAVGKFAGVAPLEGIIYEAA